MNFDSAKKDFLARNNGITELLQKNERDAKAVNFNIFKKNDLIEAAYVANLQTVS